ncbi:DUF6281 family protein [Streptomyces sp. 24-1644]|uniref:DUF6281 family protein n=1 Tax=Streptomyces sp. 24-1644 TaxID=3457315 RepID=UPI003FA6C06C
MSGGQESPSCVHRFTYRNATYQDVANAEFTVGEKLGTATQAPCDDTGRQDGNEEPGTTETASEVDGISPEVAVAIGDSPAARRRPEITPRAVEEFWRDVPLPSPCTDRERRLVYTVVYQVRDAHHRNGADPDDICATVGQVGLAALLRRAGGPLTPLETLTAHYASTHAHPAWRYRLAPMRAAAAFQAVRDDPRATRELLVAALALLPGLPDPGGSAAAELRARLTPRSGNG